jgi:hypothetical protein
MSELVIRKKESVSLPTCGCQFDLSHHEGDCNAFGDELAYISDDWVSQELCYDCAMYYRSRGWKVIRIQ